VLIENVQLKNDDVHLHFAPVTAERGFDALLAEARAHLSQGEVAAALRFRFERHRILYTFAHSFLRVTLASYLDVAPSALVFEQLEHGRPELVDRALRFNLSHTDGMVMVGVTATADIGVDVERVEPERAEESLARRVFTPDEVRGWRGDAEWFFDHWTLKESYMKARGVGLSLGLQSFGFDGPRLMCAPAFDEPTRWQFLSLAASPSHRAAACVRADAPPVWRVVGR
jgi:4'-phosphopantetheinyl transferase